MKIQSIKYRLTKGIAVIGYCLLVISQQSCSDFLDLKPLNKVVLENYWTKESDVTSVLMGCYESLCSEASVTRMGLWGEARSDNMIIGTSTSQELEQLIKEDLLPSNSYCNWEAFYKTINRCNIAIHYAPVVQEVDPNYTISEMKANIAEATFIRSLCYFYLIRTFRDVPFSREPSIDDTEDYRIPADSFNVVLNNLIEDLELVKDDAQLYFRKPDPEKEQQKADERDNTARVTRPAIYALLADLYLWQGNWQKCVECCDYIIDFKQNEYENLKRRLQNDVVLFNDIPLIKEERNGTSGNAYNKIFGEGNSFESIFELTFDDYYFVYDNQGKCLNDNKYVGDYYAHENNGSASNGRLAAFEKFYGELPQKGNDVFTSANDCRAYESIYPASTTSFYVAKYARSSISITGSGTNTKVDRANDWRSWNEANWIIYRLTDVMLMKAEALVQLGSDQFEAAFSLVNAVSRRAVNSLTPGAGEILKFDDYKDSQETMEQLVMAERHRELMFEGKRWYDLLRQARRTGSTRMLATTVTEKQITNISGIQIRLADPNALYLPYYRNELKVNPYLKQNPAYQTGDDADLEKN